MNAFRTPRVPSSHPPSLPRWLLCAALFSPVGIQAATPADSRQPPKVQRLENPEDRAALADSINTAIELAKARKTQKPARTTQVTTIAVQIPSRQTRSPAMVKSNRLPPAPFATVPADVADPGASRLYIVERAAELAASAPPTPAPAPESIRWDYQGEHGPQAWGQLHPAFSVCEQGRQQSPIHITPQDTAPGPAEPLQFGSQAFGGTVTHTGHGIELETEHTHTLLLRGTSWRLVKVQFHHPAEERIHFQGFPMSTDLVYRSAQGQTAVLSVPMQLGEPNAFIHRVWTRMPLAPHDRVRLTEPELRLQDLLPTDLRYFMYLGSLTSPPCTEGVLRIVLQTPASVSRDQWQLLTRMTPPSARPTQPLHGRLVREAR